MAERSYFTLVSREPDGPWVIEFGDHNRSVVVTEREEMHNHPLNVNLRFKIIRTADAQQATIDTAVAALNQIASRNCKMKTERWDDEGEHYIRGNLAAYVGATIQAILIDGIEIEVTFTDGRQWKTDLTRLFDHNGMFFEEE